MHLLGDGWTFLLIAGKSFRTKLTGGDLGTSLALTVSA
jgi:hypothetical protein